MQKSKLGVMSMGAAGVVGLLATAGSALAQCDGTWTGVGVPGISNTGSGWLTAWDPDGAGPTPELLYASGRYKLANTTIVNSLASWEPLFNSQNPFGIWRNVSGGVTTNAGGFGAAWTTRAVGTEMIVGGEFARAGGVAAANIAKLDGLTGAWTPYHTGTNGPVFSTAIFNGQLFISGFFRQASGRTCDSVARWDGASWRPVGPGFQEPDPMTGDPVTSVVYALAVYNNTLYAGGRFVWSGVDMQGEPIDCEHWARWNAQAGVWQSILGGQPLTAPFPYTPAVYTLFVYGNQLYGGGVWDNVGASFARTTGGIPVGVNGGVFKPFDTSQVYAMAQVGTELIVGGDFSVAGVSLPATCRNIVRWNGTRYFGTAGDGILGPVTGLASFRGQVAAMGNLGVVPVTNGARMKGISWFDGAAWRRMGKGFDNPVSAMEVYNGQLIAAGNFGRTDDIVQATGVASFNGSTWAPVGAGLQLLGGSLSLPAVYDLTPHDNTLVAVGEFNFSGGTSLGNIAAWNGASWQPRGFVDGPVFAATSYRGRLYIGGDLINYGNVAQYDGFGNYDAVTFGVDNAVLSLGTLGNDLLAAGAFTLAGGIQTGPIARWNYDTERWSAISATQTTWQPPPGNPPPPAVVYTTAVIDGVLYAGGDFTNIQNANPAIAKFARLNPNTGRWERLGNGPGFDVYSIKSIAGRIVVGGAGGQNLAAWDGTAWRNVNNGTDGPVFALEAFQNKLFAGGNFLLAGGLPSSYFSSYTPTFPVAITQQPVDVATCPGGSISLSVGVTGTGPITYRWFRNNVEVPNTNVNPLVFNPVAPGQAGQWRVLISNGCSSVTSNTVTVTLCPADFNCDGFLDFFDYADYIDAFDAGNPRADFDGDGFIDFFDFAGFSDAFETGC